MEEFTKEIFRAAIAKEESAYVRYKELSDSTMRDSLKQLFLNLAKEEMIHKRLFESMDIAVLKIANNGDVKKLLLADKGMLPDDKVEANKKIDYAIFLEEKDIKDYTTLASYMEFGESRDALKEIILQEKRHKTILEKVKLDFNNGDWKALRK